MSFDLDDRGADELDAVAQRDGVPFGSGVEAGFFSGVATSAVQGMARGAVAKPALLLGDAVTPVLRPAAQAVDKALGTSLDAWLEGQQKRNVTALQDLRADPLTTGYAGQVVGGLFDLGGSATLFTPAGAAVLAGYDKRQEMIGQGIDPNTATVAGAISGGATYVGVKAPLTLGAQALGRGGSFLAKNAAYGGAVSISSGVAERGFTRDLLKAAGYPEQAKAMEPYDLTSVAAEGTLGALFSGGAAALHARATVSGQAATDAALSVTTTDHALRGVAPGVAVDARSTAAHSSALGTALDQVLRNDPVNVGDALADAAYLRPLSTATADARAELHDHVADLLPAGAGSGFAMPANAPRGIRSNNPGNIVATGTPWQGQTGTDGRFATFDTPEAGIRALGRNLLAYQDQHGLDTVAGIIGRWAPRSENDTGAYVRNVSQALGVAAGDRLNLRDTDTLQRLTAAIVRHENGAQPYPAAMLRAGIRQALDGQDGGVPAGRTDFVADRGSAPSGAPEAVDRRNAGVVPHEQLARGDDVDVSDIIQPPEPAYASRVVDEAGNLQRVFHGTGDAFEQFGHEADVQSMRNILRGTSSEGQIDGRFFFTDHPGVASEYATEARIGGEGANVQASHLDIRNPLEIDAKGARGRDKFQLVEQAIGDAIDGGHDGVVLRNVFDHVADNPRMQTEPHSVFIAFRRDQIQSAFQPREGFARSVERQQVADRPQGAGRGAAPAVQPLPEGRQPGATAAPPPRREPGVTPPSASDADRQEPSVTASASRIADADASIRAAADVARLMPDMRVVLEDGTERSAREVLERADQAQQQAVNDSKAFDAAINCFLRT